MELKNCPFCGGKAFLRKLYTNYIVDAKHKENCPMWQMCLPKDTIWVTREAAIAAWNKRKEPAKIEYAFFENTNANEFFEYYAKKYHYPPYDMSNEIDKIDNMTDDEVIKEFEQAREDSKDEELWEEDDFGLR